MAWHTHNGWTKEAIRLLGKADAIRKRITQALDLATEQDEELAHLKKETDRLRAELAAIENKRSERRWQVILQKRKELAPLQKEADNLVREAKRERRGVLVPIRDFIADINVGTYYGAGFQVVWNNSRFVILQLPGRMCYAGRGRQMYSPSCYTMYDLALWREHRKNNSGASLEQACRVATHEGRLPASVLKTWKEQAEFQAN